MLDFGFYNMDCLEGMREFPDDYFELAIVDPPYGAGFTEGGGCKGWFEKYHQTLENGGASIGTDSADVLTSTSTKKIGGALSTQELPKARRDLGLCELERPQRQKNHNVGRSPETRIF